jgi:hypothetical protein
MVSHWETMRRVPTTVEVASLLTALNVVGAEKDRLIEMARRANEPNWLTVGMPGIPHQLAGAVECERAATAITDWAPTVIPGLLQSADYAKALLSAGGLVFHQIEARVMVRINRREVITRTTNPVKLIALVSEAVLREGIAEPQVMADQLRYMNEFGERPNITVQIVPSGVGWHPGFAGPFMLFDLLDTDPVLYFEHYSSGAFVPDEHDVSVYRGAIDIIRGVALSPEDSQRFIAKVADEWEQRE